MTDQFEFEHETDEREADQPEVEWGSADRTWGSADRTEDVDEGYSPTTVRTAEVDFVADTGEAEEEKSFEQRLEQEEPEIEDDWEEGGGPPTPVAERSVTSFYPPIEPYQQGLLEVGDGQQIYWEECGNPDGRPVVYLHGGPGGGSLPDARGFFDPARYRILLFDQRGCGRSRPLASDPGADLSTNTTWHLVADIERLRQHRGIERWQVFGGSWGSGLALAYAEEHPERVTALVLRGIFTLRRRELDWYYNGGAGAIFPDLFEKFLAPLGGSSFEGHAIAAYAELLADPDPAVHLPAGLAWSTWEAATVTLVEDPEMVTTFSDPAFALAFARIENHYFTHGGWFTEGQLIARADRLKGIPGVIVQGRYDMATPAFTAWDLHRAWPEADFALVPAAGHSSTEPGILERLVAANDHFAGEGGGARPEVND